MNYTNLMTWTCTEEATAGWDVTAGQLPPTTHAAEPSPPWHPPFCACTSLSAATTMQEHSLLAARAKEMLQSFTAWR